MYLRYPRSKIDLDIGRKPSFRITKESSKSIHTVGSLEVTPPFLNWLKMNTLAYLFIHNGYLYAKQITVLVLYQTGNCRRRESMFTPTNVVLQKQEVQ